MQLITLSLLALALCQNLIVNGGFEADGGAACACCLIDGGVSNAMIAPWYISSSYKIFELNDRSFWVAWGNRSLDLSSYEPYTVSQAVTVVPQKLYALRFKLNSNSGAVQNKVGFVSITGSTTSYFRHVYNYGMVFANQWKNVTILFQATTASTTISIGSLTPGAYGPVIDEVSLTLFTSGCWFPYRVREFIEYEYRIKFLIQRHVFPMQRHVFVDPQKANFQSNFSLFRWNWFQSCASLPLFMHPKKKNHQMSLSLQMVFQAN